MSLGGIFAKSGTTVTVARQNLARRQNCAFSERRARRGVGELLGQSTKILRGELGKSSSWDLHIFYGENCVGNMRH